MNKTCTRITTEDLVSIASRGFKTFSDTDQTKLLDFLGSQRLPDGSYMDRSGKSDPYYTSFGVMASEACASQSSAMTLGFIRKTTLTAGDFINLSTMIQLCSILPVFPGGNEIKTLLTELESFRSKDGSYSVRGKHMDSGSTYAAYLALLAYSSHGLEIPEKERINEFTKKVLLADGSFANEPETPTGTATTSSAGIILESAISGKKHPKTIEYLEQCLPEDKKGFKITPEAPFPDLLSTSAALYAFYHIDLEKNNLRVKILSFVSELRMGSGGFKSMLYDDAADTEFTFHAMLVLGIIS